jgi:hypothetical protein
METTPMREQEGPADSVSHDADKTRSESFLSVYANIVEMHRTPFDVRLTVGEIESFWPRLWIEDRVAVTEQQMPRSSLAAKISAGPRQFRS